MLDQSHNPAEALGRHSVALVGLLVVSSAGLAGCLEDPPELDHVFSVDEVRYWWGGENESLLVVNFTFTNQQTFTVGEDSHPPWIRVTVWEYERTEEQSHLHGGPEYRSVGWVDGGRNRFTLYMDGPGPWEDRWYDEKAQQALGITSHSPVVGPVRLPPNASVSPEIVFQPRNHYTGTEGYYAIQIHIIQDYPQEMREGNSTNPFKDYYTGCFNHDTEEFYGIWETEGRYCNIWNCNDPSLTARYSLAKTNGIPKLGYIPACDATDAVGPYYEDMEWGDG